MPKRRIVIKLLSRTALAMLAVALFSATYLQMPLNELPEIALYFPAMMIHEPVFTVPLVVADVALFALVMIAKTSQFRSILRCYVYAGIGYAIGIYLISSGNNHALFVPFYGTLGRLDCRSGSEPFPTKGLVAPCEPDPASENQTPLPVAKERRTIACTGVRESGGFEIENLSRVPGDAYRYPTDINISQKDFPDVQVAHSLRHLYFLE